MKPKQRLDAPIGTWNLAEWFLLAMAVGVALVLILPLMACDAMRRRES